MQVYNVPHPMRDTHIKITTPIELGITNWGEDNMKSGQQCWTTLNVSDKLLSCIDVPKLKINGEEVIEFHFSFSVLQCKSQSSHTIMLESIIRNLDHTQGTKQESMRSRINVYQQVQAIYVFHYENRVQASTEYY
jgi:hypothetical protein